MFSYIEKLITWTQESPPRIAIAVCLSILIGIAVQRFVLASDPPPPAQQIIYCYRVGTSDTFQCHTVTYAAGGGSGNWFSEGSSQ